MMQLWGCRTAFSSRLWAIRALDKLIEQLAKGKAMEKISGQRWVVVQRAGEIPHWKRMGISAAVCASVRLLPRLCHTQS